MNAAFPSHVLVLGTISYHLKPDLCTYIVKKNAISRFSNIPDWVLSHVLVMYQKIAFIVYHDTLIIVNGGTTCTCNLKQY